MIPDRKTRNRAEHRLTLAMQAFDNFKVHAEGLDNEGVRQRLQRIQEELEALQQAFTDWRGWSR